jgi:hypothetical protein
MLQRYTHLEADLVRKYSEGITKNLNIGAMNEQPASTFKNHSSRFLVSNEPKRRHLEIIGSEHSRNSCVWR